MKIKTDAQSVAEVCNDQHYFESGRTSSGTKYWMCVRCGHIRPFGIPTQRKA